MYEILGPIFQHPSTNKQKPVILFLGVLMLKVKAPAIKPNNLSLICKTHMVKEGTQLLHLSSNIYTRHQDKFEEESLREDLTL